MKLYKAVTEPVVTGPVSGLILLVLVFISVTVATAAETAEPEKKEIPAFSASDVEPDLIDEDLGPEISIQQFDNREVQEYSINDHVYMIKITPKYGSPYYLVDPDGTGEMEYKRDTLGLEVNPPQWTLFRW